MLATLPPELLKDGFEPQTLRSRWKGKKWWNLLVRPCSALSNCCTERLLSRLAMFCSRLIRAWNRRLTKTENGFKLPHRFSSISKLWHFWVKCMKWTLWNPLIQDFIRAPSQPHQQSGSEAKCKYHCQLLLHQKIGPLVKVFSILSRFIGPINLANTIAMLIWLQIIWLRLHQTTANCHYTKCIYFCRTFRRKNIG